MPTDSRPPLSTKVSASAPAQVILVVDDNAVLRLVAKATLERHGYRCLVAENGRDAVSIARNGLVHAVVLDVDMPKMDGLSVLRLLRQGKVTQKLPVMILTAHVERDIIADGAMLGADEFMSKPFRPDDLVSRVGEMLAKSAA